MAGTTHLEILVEEPSTEAFLNGLLPRILPIGISFQVHAFQGKSDLLGKLEARLRGYAAWLPPDWRVIVLVDRDDDDCQLLKLNLDQIARRAGILTRRQARSTRWQLINRILIEELEAWYFGDWTAVALSYPRLPTTIPQRQAFRDPDAVLGGTWEAFERVLRQHGYFKTGLPKIEVARTLARQFEPTRNRSASFRAFHSALIEAIT